MDTNEFIPLAKELVCTHINQRFDDVEIKTENVYVVWVSKTLKNAKALLSTTINDGMYYELTYNGEVNHVYFDAYKKVENRLIDLNKRYRRK